MRWHPSSTRGMRRTSARLLGGIYGGRGLRGRWLGVWSLPAFVPSFRSSLSNSISPLLFFLLMGQPTHRTTTVMADTPTSQHQPTVADAPAPVDGHEVVYGRTPSGEGPFPFSSSTRPASLRPDFRALFTVALLLSCLP